MGLKNVINMLTFAQNMDYLKPKVHFTSLKGMSYREAWDRQTALHKELVRLKLAQRDLDDDKKQRQIHHLIFCEHHHVYTLGKSGSESHLLIDSKKREEEDIEYFKINRGGDITYHGPGQITGYPIFDLDEFFTDVHRYVRTLEECIIQFLKAYDIEGMRLPAHTGVWLAPNSKSIQYRKICAIGVHLSRWVTMHGFAFNVNTDLSYFDHIVPCGIVDVDKTVTSLQKELGSTIDFLEAQHQLKLIFAEQFDFDFTTK